MVLKGAFSLVGFNLVVCHHGDVTRAYTYSLFYKFMRARLLRWKNLLLLFCVACVPLLISKSINKVYCVNTALILR
jgi:hypothetical protein